MKTFLVHKAIYSELELLLILKWGLSAQYNSKLKILDLGIGYISDRWFQSHICFCAHFFSTVCVCLFQACAGPSPKRTTRLWAGSASGARVAASKARKSRCSSAPKTSTSSTRKWWPERKDRLHSLFRPFSAEIVVLLFEGVLINLWWKEAIYNFFCL